MENRFFLGIARDFRDAGLLGDAEPGLRRLAAAGTSWEVFDDDDGEIPASAASAYDALLIGGERLTRATLEQDEVRVGLVALVGVGLNAVDLDACRERGVLVTTTRDAVRRPMASAAMAYILALAHMLPAKDALVREGRWDERSDYVGVSLAGRTLGIVGFGNIGREIAKLSAPFDMRVLAHSRRLTDESAAAAGVTRADLDELLASSDVVCLACPLTAETHRLIDRDRLALMKPTAFLVNVARGAVVDQEALAEALAERRIAGAGLDVLDPEPPDPGDPILGLDNVILAPHGLGYLDGLTEQAMLDACTGIAAVARGERPRDLVDPEVWEAPAFQRKLAAPRGQPTRGGTP